MISLSDWTEFPERVASNPGDSFQRSVHVVCDLHAVFGKLSFRRGRREANRMRYKLLDLLDLLDLLGANTVQACITDLATLKLLLEPASYM